MSIHNVNVSVSAKSEDTRANTLDLDFGMKTSDEITMKLHALITKLGEGQTPNARHFYIHHLPTTNRECIHYRSTASLSPDNSTTMELAPTLFALAMRWNTSHGIQPLPAN